MHVLPPIMLSYAVQQLLHGVQCPLVDILLFVLAAYRGDEGVERRTADMVADSDGHEIVSEPESRR